MKADFTTTCSMEHLAEIRRFLHKVLTKYNINDQIKNEIVLAVDEACANAMIHGNNCNPQSPLHIEVELTDQQFIVQISDVGNLEEDFTEQKDNEIEELIENRRRGGLGLKLMYSIMDDVNYFAKEGKNICSLTKKWPKSS
jgi:serine/threonine-protein kinase RsbW